MRTVPLVLDTAVAEFSGIAFKGDEELPVGFQACTDAIYELTATNRGLLGGLDEITEDYTIIPGTCVPVDIDWTQLDSSAGSELGIVAP